MNLDDRKKLAQLYGEHGIKLFLHEWESIANILVGDDCIMVAVDTYEVKVLVREDRYLRKGLQVYVYKNSGSRWYQESDYISWDDDFEPFVYEKVGRRKTAEEFTEQREWEKMCHRPGNKRTPLDSYERVLDPFVRSTDRMEKHY